MNSINKLIGMLVSTAAGLEQAVMTWESIKQASRLPPPIPEPRRSIGFAQIQKSIKSNDLQKDEKKFVRGVDC